MAHASIIHPWIPRNHIGLIIRQFSAIHPSFRGITISWVGDREYETNNQGSPGEILLSVRDHRDLGPLIGEIMGLVITITDGRCDRLYCRILHQDPRNIRSRSRYEQARSGRSRSPNSRSRSPNSRSRSPNSRSRSPNSRYLSERAQSGTRRSVTESNQLMETPSHSEVLTVQNLQQQIISLMSQIAQISNQISHNASNAPTMLTAVSSPASIGATTASTVPARAPTTPAPSLTAPSLTAPTPNAEHVSAALTLLSQIGQR